MKKFLSGIISLVIVIALTIATLEIFSSHQASEAINKQAPVQTAQTITIHASPAVVYNLMTGVNQWTAWHTDVQEPVLKDAFQKGNSFNWKSGGLTIRSTIHTAIPNRKMGWSGPAFGSFAIHNWTFTPLPGGYTRVDVEESMEGWLVTLLSHQFQSGLERSLHVWLKNLKNESEKQFRNQQNQAKTTYISALSYTLFLPGNNENERPKRQAIRGGRSPFRCGQPLLSSL